MKLLKTTLLTLTALSALTLVACSKSKTTEKGPTTKATTKDGSSSKVTTSKRTTTEAKTTDDFDPEVAMDNFIFNANKLKYTVKTDDLTTYVCSEDLIILDYTSDSITDLAWMSVNDEMFEGKLKDNIEVSFVEYGSAVGVATKNLRTLNSIDLVSMGNIWDIFTNVGTTGEYVTNSEYIQYLLCYLADYPKDFAGTITDMKLVIADNEATSATLSGHYGFSNVDLVCEITFDANCNTEKADAWMSNPTYPNAKTTWDEYDMGAFCALFYRDDEDCVPFIDGISYAYYADYEKISTEGIYFAMDRHLSQTDYDNYITKLGTNGYALEDERDGEKCYHKMLRSDVGCVSSIYLEYEDGVFFMEVKPYYVCDEYDRELAINTLLNDNGLIVLPDTDVKSWYAINGTGAQMDSTLYVNDYALVLDVDLTFEDSNKLNNYLEIYKDLLVNTFDYVEHQASLLEENEYYVNFDDTKSVRYLIDGNVLKFRFKAEKSYDIDYIENDVLTPNGFPKVSNVEPYGTTWYYYTSKDEKKHEHFQNGHDYIVAFSLSIHFETETLAETFADNYATILVADYEFTKPTAYFEKESEGLTVKMSITEVATNDYSVNIIYLKDVVE